MTELFEKSIRVLELPQLLERLSQKAVSEAAKERALRLTPSTDADDVRRLQDETDAARALIGLRGSPSFSGVKDVRESLSRAERGGMLNPRELLTIAGLLTNSRRVREYYEADQGEGSVLDRMFDSLHANRFLEDKITTSILSEDEIADAASPELADIRRHKRAASAKGRQILQKIISSPSYKSTLQEALITQRDGRFVVPVKADHRGDLPGLVHDISASGATLFVEPMGVVQANNELKELEAKEKKEIERILFALSAEAAGFSEAILWDYDILVHLDLIFARGELSYQMDAARPEIRTDGSVSLRRARHPLLDPAKAVPIDIEVGRSFDTLVITGPNTGGKTVSLKTLGLLCLMAQCGLHIPAGDRSAVSVFTGILADIGDEQSIEQSLSTFSAHMTNIIGILKKANSSSLALIDELGAGTDPVEGAALAIAILEKLRARGAKIASTTHYAELKEFALRTNGIENGSCEFDIKTLRPTYRLLIGVPGKSNAFAISRRLGMDENVVIRAQELVSSDSRQFEDVVTKLESRRQSLEKQLENAQRLTQKANTEKQKAENELAKAKQNAKNEIERARAEAEKIVSRTKAQAYALLDEMEKAKKAKGDNSQVRARLRREINKMEDSSNPVENKKEETEYKLPRPLKIGDNVLIYDIDKDAVVLELPDKDDMVMVQAGIIKTRVKLSNLRLKKSENKKTNRKTRTRSASVNVDIRPSTEVDVRGQTAVEAIMAVDSAIDNAILSNIETLTIIHGKGTGVLRTEIQKHLRSVKYVKSFRLGTFGEGENGVTIVTLK